jgi:hypothetical protein
MASILIEVATESLNLLSTDKKTILSPARKIMKGIIKRNFFRKKELEKCVLHVRLGGGTGGHISSNSNQFFLRFYFMGPILLCICFILY